MRNVKRWAFEPNAGRVDRISDADDLIADCLGYDHNVSERDAYVPKSGLGQDDQG